MGTLLAYSHMTNPLLEVNPGQSTLNRIQTTSRSGLSQTGLKPLWLNAHSRLDSVNANQCALNRIECALSVQCERAFILQCCLPLEGVEPALHLVLLCLLTIVYYVCKPHTYYRCKCGCFTLAVVAPCPR